MNLQLIKKYIAAYLSTPTTRLTTVSAPMAGIQLQNGDEESFFYPSTTDENLFFEEYGEHVYTHTYDPATRSFKTTEK
ncbi:hypothetical protein [Pediococcus stilesii]|uniref:Uncharacterized protein n=1 Tax=Pediococcus stilesii TaxID=331679 RepID=A0A0R2KXL6_9LACO|nr:hypothetical protein [Pediococcus stilesii]KRN94193.1 hypothetical protein IV81_GL001607 [Pediococcus stilesii]